MMMITPIRTARIFCWNGRFRSTVMRTSNCVAAARKSAPFFIPCHSLIARLSDGCYLVRRQIVLEVARDAFIKQQFHCGRKVILSRAQELPRPARELRWETDRETRRAYRHLQDTQKGG